jgi:uncharacterized integral membrane protein
MGKFTVDKMNKTKTILMNKTKTIVLIIVSVLALIIILQNTQKVETHFLFIKVTMPKAFLLMLTFLLGFIGGAVSVFSFSLKKESVSKEKYDSNQPNV